MKMAGNAREVTSRDRERLFFLMALMMRSGQTTEGSLRAVAKAFRAEKKEEISAALNIISQKVAQGKTLSKAMEAEPVLFQDIHRAAILAGEASNNMQQAFQTLQMLEDKKIKTARSGMAELLTPAALLLLSIASLFNTGLNTLPVLSQVKKSQGKPMGLLPSGIMEFTNTIAEFWYIIVIVAVALGLIAYSSLKTTGGKFWLDKYTLQVPLLGKFIIFKTYSSMLLYFPSMLASGVKPKQMIPIMEALSKNAVLKRRIDTFNQVLTTGGQLSKAMEKSGFPDIVVTPVLVSEHYAGNETGINDVMIEGLEHSYNIMERQLEDTHGRFITVFSGILWIMGGAVMLMEMLSIIMAQT